MYVFVLVQGHELYNVNVMLGVYLFIKSSFNHLETGVVTISIESPVLLLI